ncbi:hypothetical protein DENSPDRAFT_231597 [Dentipellis sp. KUC8613]|nr:hypothetical protein DENSPDRAFT_231597 [Dentipellis sp. KUC8613]
MGQGFDSVVETSHQHYTSHRNTVRSIRFAQRHTVDTDIAPYATSFGAITHEQSMQMVSDSDRDARAIDNGGVLGRLV